MRPKITVAGSINIDIVVKCKQRPKPGETVFGDYHRLVPGGKGANQACACARLGADVALIGCVGDDELRDRALENLLHFGVDCTSVRTLKEVSTGAAFITVDSSGQNSIIITGGANAKVTTNMVEQSREAIASADVLLVQMENPLEVVENAVSIAKRSGVRVVLNPAPATPIPDRSILWNADVFVANEHEAEYYTGAPVEKTGDALEACRLLRKKGPGTILVTLGESGSVAVTEDDAFTVAARPVSAVDTTAAGDTYIGGFCVEWLRTVNIADAMRYGSAAAAISVQRFGAQTSIPSQDEVRDFLEYGKEVVL